MKPPLMKKMAAFQINVTFSLEFIALNGLSFSGFESGPLMGGLSRGMKKGGLIVPDPP